MGELVFELEKHRHIREVGVGAEEAETLVAPEAIACKKAGDVRRRAPGPLCEPLVDT